MLPYCKNHLVDLSDQQHLIGEAKALAERHPSQPVASEVRPNAPRASHQRYSLVALRTWTYLHTCLCYPLRSPN